MADFFTCEECGGTFAREWSKEDAEAERRRIFGGPVEEDDVEICDVCFKRLMAKLNG